MSRVLLRVVLCLFPLQCVAAEPFMYAHSINVGQGAATFLEFPCGCMLIDTGAQSEQHVDHLVDYLRGVFERRPDLQSTIDVVVITHPHKDHTWGLEAVARTFPIRTYIDNGVFTRGSGKRNPHWLRKQVEDGMLNIQIREIKDEEVAAVEPRVGLTDAVIDPFECADCDPQIRILSGYLDVNPGWSSEDHENLNNHSVVVRVDFGESSFLYTGDMETPALQTMINWYRDTDTLDVDVYQVGHHGSHNGTSLALLEATTPLAATIGVGHWTFGEDSIAFGINTHSFGHPRKVVLDLLTSAIPGDRGQPLSIMAGHGVHNFRPYTVARNIYATAWDGDFRIRAETDGDMRVERVPSTGAVAVVGVIPGAAAPIEPESLAAAAPMVEPDSQDLLAELNQAAKSAGLDPSTRQALLGNAVRALTEPKNLPSIPQAGVIGGSRVPLPAAVVPRRPQPPVVYYQWDCRCHGWRRRR